MDGSLFNLFMKILLLCLMVFIFIDYTLDIPYRPYSPFQKTNNMAEYAVARLDDVLNWGRKVIKI